MITFSAHSPSCVDALTFAYLFSLHLSFQRRILRRSNDMALTEHTFNADIRIQLTRHYLFYFSNYIQTMKDRSGF